jgi:hypothetical protein
MEKMDRKSFLRKAGFLSITALSGSALLSACGGGSSSQEMENTGMPEENEAEPLTEEATPGQDTETVSADCSEYNQNLTEADMNTREALNYVKESPKPDQNCKNCRFWQAEKFDGPCGGCQLISNGAVTPQGWCQSWVAQQV